MALQTVELLFFFASMHLTSSTCYQQNIRTAHELTKQLKNGVVV